jgi:uncharacterized membrane protein YcaP (DUF421 family)
MKWTKKNMSLRAIKAGFAKPLFTEPLLLIRDGRLIRRNLKRLLLTPEELMAWLRRQGVRTLASVSMCMLNPDGEVSVYIAA